MNRLASLIIPQSAGLALITAGQRSTGTRDFLSTRPGGKPEIVAEARVAVCELCKQRPDHPSVQACDIPDCPNRERRRA
jgi:hypothetical protein